MDKKRWIRGLFITSWLALIFAGITAIFWYTDWQYSLPTPVPKQYHTVNTGTYVDLGNKLPMQSQKPVFIHFFNPDCPCSRFNVPYFKSLARHYGHDISFAIVVLSKNKAYTPQSIRDKFDLDVPVSFDSSLAAACGVYSTPQAVLLDEGHHLYYRGNYNKSRYCANEKSNYARMAIDSLLMHKQDPVFSVYALTAYGCQLPVCKK